MKYEIVFSYLAGATLNVEGDQAAIEAQLQAFADQKKVRKDRPAIGTLEFEWMTDQCDVFFRRAGRRHKFAVLMAT